MAEDVISVKVVADTSTAEQQIKSLQQSLQNITSKPININNAELVEANRVAQELRKNLTAAMNTNTGKLDLAIFNNQMQKSNMSIEQYAANLQKLGPEGTQAFMQLSQAIAMADAPVTQLNKKIVEFGNTLKRTVSWQMSSSIIHGVMGAFQGAIGYAKDLNESLTNIRIVTGQSIDQMAKFAEQANKSAKALHTTTTEYTDASLIYYQQGLNDKEVQARTEATIKISNVTGQSAQDVSQQMTSIWNNFAQGSDNLEHYGDVLAKLGAETATSSAEIAQGMQKFAAVGQTVGLSYEYAAAALATVTATTRESADTVGTAFRTLFSRLEGLKLGETLEDGTDLNKYSAALASVGVNIKDTSGQLKNMDTILDELMIKWDTLGKDQQVALAQTVGGARQYTQIMALLNNSDFFQQNVERANEADGTLQKQQEIYETGWQAASKRLKASKEDLYDSLIDDQAIIKFTDGFATAIDAVAGLTDGLGGLSGILTSVAGIFMSKYAKEIPTVLSNLKTNFQTTFMPNKVNEQSFNMQDSIIGQLGTLGGKAQASGDLIGAQRIANLQEEIKLKQQYMKSSSKMSEEEKAAAMLQMQLSKAQGEQKIKYAEKQQSAEEKYQSTVKKSMTQMEAKQKAFKELQDKYEPQKGKDENGNEIEIKSQAQQEYERKVQEAEDLRTQELGQLGLDTKVIGKKKFAQQTAAINAKYNKTVDAAAEDYVNGYAAYQDSKIQGQKDANFNKSEAERQIKTFDDQAFRVGQLKALSGDGVLGSLDNNGKAINDQFQGMSTAQIKQWAQNFKNEFSNALGADSQSNKILEDLLGLDDNTKVEEVLAKVRELKAKIDQELNGETSSGGLLQQAEDDLNKMISPTSEITGINAGTLDERSEYQQQKGEFSAYQNGAPQQNNQIAAHQMSGEELFGKTAASLMMLSSALSSIDSTIQTLISDDASGLQKVTAMISSLGMNLMFAKNGAELLAPAIAKGATALSSFGGIASSAASGITALLGSLGAVLPLLLVMGGLGIAKYISEKNKKELTEEYEDIKQDSQEIIDQVKNNQQLLQSYDNASNAYSKAQQNLGKGLGTYQDVIDAQQALIQSVEELGEAYEISGTSAALLTGNTSKLEKLIDQARNEELKESDKAALEGVQASFKENSLNNKNKAIANTQTYHINKGEGPSIHERQAIQGLDSITRAVDKYGSEKIGISESLLSDNKKEFKDAESLLKYYDEISIALDRMNESMSDSEKELSGLYQQYSKQKRELSEVAEEYRKYYDIIKANKIEEYDINQGVDGKAKNSISDLKSYEEYRQKMIEALAEEQNLLKDGQVIKGKQEQYDNLVKSVDAYLNTLPNVKSSEQGNLSLISKGLDDIVKKTGLSKNSLIDLYTDLGKNGDVLFEINWDAIGAKGIAALKKFVSDLQGNAKNSPISLQMLLAEDNGLPQQVKDAIAQGQQVADENKIKVKIQLLTDFDIGEGRYGDPAVLQQVLDVINDTFGTNYGISDVSFMSDEDFNQLSDEAIIQQQSDYFDQLDENVDQQGTYVHNARRDQILASYNFRHTKEDNGIDESSPFYDSADEIAQYDSFLKAEENGEDYDKGEFNRTRDYLQGKGIVGEDGKFLIDEEQVEAYKAVGEAQLELDAATNQLTDSQERQNALVAEQNDSWPAREQMLVNEAAAFNVDMDAVRAYAGELERSGQIKRLEGESDEAYHHRMMRIALDYQENTEGLEELRDAYKGYTEAQKKSDQPKMDKYFQAMQKAIHKITKMPIAKIGKDFINNAKSAGILQKALEGDASAVKELIHLSRESFAKELEADLKKLANDTTDEKLKKKYGAMAESIKGNMQTLQEGVESLDIGEPLENAGAETEQAAAAMIASLQALGKSPEQIVEAMAGVGIKATPITTPIGPTTIHHQESQYDIIEDATGRHVVPLPDYTKDSTPDDGEVIGFKLEKAEGDAAGNVGSGGGGGGGGGGKPKVQKAHKKADASERYHPVKGKIKSNELQLEEVGRQKDRLFGEASIRRAKEEIELQKEKIRLQQQYVNEINDYLKKDKEDFEKFFKKNMGIEIDFDDEGIITNYDAVAKKILDLENYIIDLQNAEADEQLIENMNQRLEDAHYYLDNYEETLELSRNEMAKLIEDTDQLNDLFLDLAKSKVELNIDLDEDSLQYIEYMLDKLSDEAFDAAEAITWLGAQTQNAMDKVQHYEDGIAEIFSNHGLDINDLMTNGWTIEDLLDKGFTKDEIETIREWRDGILEAIQSLNEMRDTIFEKVDGAFETLNGDIQESIELFDHYDTVLTNLKDITDLLGQRLPKETRDLVKATNEALLLNSRESTKSAFQVLNDLKATKDNYLNEYKRALQSNDQQAIKQWEETLKNIDEAIREAEEGYLDSWQNSLDKAREVFEDAVEQIGQDFEERLSGLFGTFNAFKDSFDRAKKIDEDYLDDYDKLYELSKLTRDITNSMDDTDNINGKRRLADLMKEINKLQADGVELSKYDVDILRKRYELELARQQLEDEKNSGSLVRLSRDQDGNWGYVYTQDEDSVAQAEQDYENKLHALQQANDKYIRDLQDKMISLKQDMVNKLKDVFLDENLTDAEREAQIRNIRDWYETQVGYYQSQMDNALGNQQNTYGLMLDTYKVTSAELLDTFKETNYSVLSGLKETSDWVREMLLASGQLEGSLRDAFLQYQQNIDAANGAAGYESPEETLQGIANTVTTVEQASQQATETVANMGQVMKDTFAQVAEAAADWEITYGKEIDNMITAYEALIQKLNEVIAKLKEMNTEDTALWNAIEAYRAAERAHTNGEMSDAEWETAKDSWNQFLDDWAAGRGQGIGNVNNDQEYKGDWRKQFETAGILTKDIEDLAKDVEENFGSVTALDEATKNDIAEYIRANIQAQLAYYQDAWAKSLISPSLSSGNADTGITQDITIYADFPNVESSLEIKEAFDNIENDAAQYANRKDNID